MTNRAPIANAAQFDYWNDHAGRTWAALQAQLDRQIAPLGLRAMDALCVTPGERVLDVGCGCGDTSLALAARAGPDGAVVGLDLSAPMLDVARTRGAAVANASFLQADAQTARFDVPFDAAFSRFGVMFFADPVAAFTNLRAALRPGGRLAFVCWRAAAENVWMAAPYEAALPHLPPLAAPDDPDAAGPFAFARAERGRDILGAAGFADIRIQPCDMQVGGFDLDCAVELALRVGPLGRVLREAPERGEVVTEVVRRALGKFETGNGVWMPSASWIVTAAG
jgi:SAM-dependent methyltransferase